MTRRILRGGRVTHSLLSVLLTLATPAWGELNNKYNLTTETGLRDGTAASAIEAFWQKGETGKFIGRKKVPIRYIKFIHPNEVGAVVISSGRTESYIKYKEVIYDLYRLGYTIYAHDHRGQGLSGRMTENPQMGHVWNFDHYIDDFKKFYSETITPHAHRKKYLLAHSMGGAIASIYLERYANDFDAAALSSPMHEPATAIFYSDAVVCGMLGITSRLRDFLIWLFGIEPRYVLNGHNYEVDKFEENELTQSRIRYERFVAEYTKNEQVRLGSATTHWASKACDAAEDARENAARVTIPILVFQAEKDTLVTADGQNEFCRNLKAGGKNQCIGGAPIIVPGAYHELLIEKDEYRIPTLTRIVDFFRSN